MLVLSNREQLAGIGEAGEIAVRTPYLAAGYLGETELTRERFIVNPFTGRTDDRLYKTGDLGRYLPDGSVEFIGRRDRQVKVRGFRIELEEIEAVLASHPTVREVVVETADDTAGNKYLAAYIVLAHQEASSINELQTFARERLPEYSIPSIFVPLESIPLTPNGKVDRGALPTPLHTGLTAAYVAARNETEELVAGIWAEALGMERVGVEDNFFKIGGHSLLATQVLSRVRKVFQVEIPLRHLFEQPTVAYLALMITREQHKQDQKTSTVITRINPENEINLLTNLERLSDEEVTSLLSTVLAEAESGE